MRTHRLDQHFIPLHCPYAACRSKRDAPFLWRRKGFYTRKVDQRFVQRFLCLTCSRTFSSQAFRLDFRYRLPWLHVPLFWALVSKLSLRQAARNFGCHRDTLLRRLPRLGEHAKQLHQLLLAEHRRCRGGLVGTFQLDELETFETDRRLFPVSVPILIEKSTWFVVHVASATLPARGRLRPRDQKRKQRYEEQLGKRLNGSKEAVSECYRALEQAAGPETKLFIQTDQKKSYAPILRAIFGQRFDHHLEHSSTPRNRRNLLFAINHALAQTRDGLGRLVRRNWGHSKKRRNLEWHLWVWVLYRNYLREITNKDRIHSSASALGVAPRRYDTLELLEWRGRVCWAG